MLMNKSRLEKFLYALYSLDSSDLPIPKSRIEELYNCLVTGAEVPTFKPISRVEKYLMAILGVYDADSLPNPLSRVEVLLYKLATGDDNLDDIKSFLSEHEELLAGIIRNGGINGDISFDDYEYRGYSFATGQYTLYNTKEHSMKNAALKGDTLVNIVKKQEKPFSHSADGISQNNNLQLSYSLKANTTYTRYIHVSALDLGMTSDVGMYDALIGDDGSYTQYPYNITSKGWIINTFTTKTTSVSPYMINPDTNALSNGLIHIEIDKFMIIEGDHTQEDIPYFEGMRSVENPAVTITGKNLFNASLLPQTVNIIPTSTGCILRGYSCGINMRMSRMFPNLIVGKKYVFSFQSSSSSIISAQNSIGFYNINTDEIVYYRNNEPFTLTNEMYYERYVILYGVSNETVEFSNVQLEEGSVATEYEPYKSTTVSCNEDVELRGIGNIKDELDLMTGKLTQRVGEVVFDGSEDWREYPTPSGGDDYISFFTTTPKLSNRKTGLSNSLCDRMNIGASVAIIDEFIEPHPSTDSLNNWVMIRILKSRLEKTTVGGFIKWLSNYPLTLQYELIENSIKTVDLSVVDQDGNDTELKTFDNSTHVAITSEGLVPESDIEVAKYILYMTYELTEKETTLYNTKEHSVKSAVLKGQTLVNIVNNDNWVTVYDSVNRSTLFIQNISVKKGQTYTVIGKMENSDVFVSQNLPAFRIRTGTNKDGTSLLLVQQSDAVIKQTFTNNENDTIHLRFFNQKTNYKKLMILEGDYTNVDIPYFEGMKSVENPVMTTTGKNLWYGDKDVFSNGFTTLNMSFKKGIYYFTGDVDTVYPDGPTTIVFSNTFTGYDVGVYINNPNSSATLEEDCNQVKIYTNGWSYVNSTNKSQTIKNLMLSNTYPISYEPYKSNILSTSEDVELHGVGEVKDELDLMTGEVTQRIGEVVFDGSEDWERSSHDANSPLFYTSVNNLVHKEDYLNSIICDKLMVYADSDDLYYLSTSPNGISAYNDYYGTYPNENWLYIKYTDSEGSVEKLKQWLSQNPVTVRYELTMESVKTVDLSVVDQDGNNTKLKSFDDITYVTLSSEGPIPEAELEVATKNEEVLDTMSLRMDDIYATQTTLEETSNTQSENVDATMFATTEIYEGLL